MKDIQCYNCYKWGYYASECKSKRVPRNKGDEEKNDEWCFDIGCSNHMTGKNSWFFEIDDPVNRKIWFAYNNIVSTKGIGKVMIHIKDGKIACITDVLYVPNMKSNLTSISQLLQEYIDSEGSIVKAKNLQDQY